MDKINELKAKLAAANSKLVDLDSEIKETDSRKSTIADKITAIAADLVTAKTAAQEAAKDFAFGNADEAALTETQTAVMKLETSKSAFEAALLAITEELAKLDEPRKAAAARVDRLQDMIYSRISELELQKAAVLVKLAHRAFFHKKTAYMSRDYFSKAVADLVHHCRHDDSEKISRELSTIYGLDL